MNTITWYGHSAFGIRCADTSILIDPFFTGNPTAPLPWNEIPAPDIVLVTHMHGDHSGDAVSICKKTGAKLGAIVGAAECFVEQGVSTEQVINGIGFNIGGSVVVNGIRIRMVEAFHSSEASVSVGFIITLPNGYTLYHSGDTGIFANMEIWGKLYPMDLALLPIGDVFTMDGKQAAYAAKLLAVKHVVPMHYGTFPVLAQNADEFLSYLKEYAPLCACTVMSPGQTMPLPAFSE